jgi:hypothetical protein
MDGEINSVASIDASGRRYGDLWGFIELEKSRREVLGLVLYDSYFVLHY